MTRGRFKDVVILLLTLTLFKFIKQNNTSGWITAKKTKHDYQDGNNDRNIRIRRHNGIIHILVILIITIQIKTKGGRIMEKFIETREVPCIGEYDIIIAGRYRGVAAALAARRLAARSS